MHIQNLKELDPLNEINTDLVIIGSGPVGVTIARELVNSGLRIIVLESGVHDEEAPFNDLLTVESVADPKGSAVVSRRRSFHGSGAKMWSQEQQAYGLRCRVLGGSSHAWAGKSALFDATDFKVRSWVKNSGWPIARDDLNDYFERAARHLNLGPNRYDETLFDLIGVTPPLTKGSGGLRSFFWQFARSKRDKMDMMRFGPDFASEDGQNIRVLVNATATHIDLDPLQKRFEGLEISTVEGTRYQLKAERCILAMGGIDNARLLLASKRSNQAGVGNDKDNVGRYLMDHPGVAIGRIPDRSSKLVLKTFGFYGIEAFNQVHMYQHGMAPTEETQRDNTMLNCAAYVLESRAPDDPWDAIKRLIRRRSEHILSDLLSVVSSPSLLAKGLGIKLLESPRVPESLKGLVIDAVLRFNPGLAVSEFQNRGLPHKLTGLLIDAIVEQPPRRDSRITLSAKCDALGVPIARVNWVIGDEERETLLKLSRMIASEFPNIGLPAPDMEAWVESGDFDTAAIIDMGHTSGTTRMASDPSEGVVDLNCQVFGINGLYIGGSSVFPTSGHANPTLMAVTLAVRLADYIKANGA